MFARARPAGRRSPAWTRHPRTPLPLDESQPGSVLVIWRATGPSLPGPSGGVQCAPGNSTGCQFEGGNRGRWPICHPLEGAEELRPESADAADCLCVARGWYAAPYQSHRSTHTRSPGCQSAKRMFLVQASRDSGASPRRSSRHTFWQHAAAWTADLPWRASCGFGGSAGRDRKALDRRWPWTRSAFLSGLLGRWRCAWFSGECSSSHRPASRCTSRFEGWIWCGSPTIVDPIESGCPGRWDSSQLSQCFQGGPRSDERSTEPPWSRCAGRVPGWLYRWWKLCASLEGLCRRASWTCRRSHASAHSGT